MAVVKNRNTTRNREFWDYVERVADRVRSAPETFTGARPNQEQSGNQDRQYQNEGESRTEDVVRPA